MDINLYTKKEIKFGKIIFIIGICFYVIYNFYFGWNRYPINIYEKNCDFICQLFVGVGIGFQFSIVTYVIKLIDDHIKKNRMRIINEDDFGKHPLDFEHKCCFIEQIEKIGEGTKNVYSQEVKVKMQSGKTALYKLYAQRVNNVFENTGQKNWKYLFIKYID